MEAQLEKEFRHNGGFLKAKRLVEITGTTARKKQEIEHKDQIYR